MAIGIPPISLGSRVSPALETTVRSPASAPTEGSRVGQEPFGNYVTKAIDNLQSAQSEVDAKAVDFLSGGETELHNLMIASEKLSLGLNLTLQLRNKAVEAYQEIMRTQV
jgi:flagellar hook-basal body complex protein FliE